MDQNYTGTLYCISELVVNSFFFLITHIFCFRMNSVFKMMEKFTQEEKIEARNKVSRKMIYFIIYYLTITVTLTVFVILAEVYLPEAI